MRSANVDLLDDEQWYKPQLLMPTEPRPTTNDTDEAQTQNRALAEHGPTQVQAPHVFQIGRTSTFATV